ncbi:MAG: hypothetical protein DHS20C17_17350 [Cyclobacteriaceae bacterium]|nr:MAG: hypothetical protein DHS20C17_17350 [Cyclobacteriaceae bacterium]
MTNLEVIQTWMHRVWWQQEENAIEEMFFPDGTAHGLGEEMIGPEDFKVFHQHLLCHIDKVQVKVSKHFQEGSWSSVLCQLECIKRGDPSHKLKITGSIFLRIENDKIVEAYNHFDFIGLFEQLGVLSEGTFDKCLCGDKKLETQD